MTSTSSANSGRSSTQPAPHTAWIVFLQDVNASGGVTDVTAGYLRASPREVDETARRLDAPVLLCRIFQAVPIGEMTRNRIPLVPNARRFKSGHCIRVPITSVDQATDTPAMLGLRHASVGTSALNTIRSSSRLILPIPPASGRPARSPAR